VLAALRNEASTTRVVLLTASDSDDVLKAVHMGVDGVVLKDMAPQLLIRCVRAVHAGSKWIEKVVANRAIEQLLRRETGEREVAARLTPRELEVARLIAQGFSNKAVANKLLISEGTVKLHLHHVYAKLAVDGRMALLRYLQSRGLG
jgi:DNA-binding NarL/FixJ family response regulator